MEIVELAPSGFDVKSLPCQSLSCGGGIATIYKSNIGFNATFKTHLDFTHISFEVVLASLTPSSLLWSPSITDDDDFLFNVVNGFCCG